MRYEKDDFKTKAWRFPSWRRPGGSLMDRERSPGVFYGGVTMWDEFVENITRGWNWPAYTPEGLLKRMHNTEKELAEVRKRLKNPVSLKGGGPLAPSSIRQLENKEKELIKQTPVYRNMVKKLVKYNLLPTNKLISGKDRMQFVFALWTMLELPELGKVVYYANRLIGSRYDSFRTPSTNADYIQQEQGKGRIPIPQQKKEERSRESMYDAVLNALNETVERIKKERERLLFSGTPWKPVKSDSKNDVMKTEKETNHRDVFDTTPGLIQFAKEEMDELDEYRRCYPKPDFKKEKASDSSSEVTQPGDIISDEFKAFLKKNRVNRVCHLLQHGNE